jgi:hypothetical protein
MFYSEADPPDLAPVQQAVGIIFFVFAQKNNYWLTDIFYLIFANLI